MPKPKKGESKKGFIRRCYKEVRSEGLDHKAAVGKCLGMWRTYGGKTTKGEKST